MEKNLLFTIVLLIAGSVSAQFNANNAPEIGDSMRLYVVDSAAVNLAAVTGDGVIWDYSNLIDYKGETRLIDVKSPQQTTHEVTFSNSDIAIETEGELIAFLTDDGAERINQGIVYHDQTNGNLILTLEEDQGIYYTYPFDFGDTHVDVVEGTATFEFMGQTVNSPAVGKIYTAIDGRGTLKMGLTGVYNDVIRYNITDTIRIATPIGEYTAIHNQFEYYDHSVSNLPIFTHSYLWFGPTGGTPRNEFSFVLSKDIITTSLTEEVLAQSKVYPNPANDFVNVELPEGVNNAEITIVDGIGRIVLKKTTESSSVNLDVSHLKEGAYFVQIRAENAVTVKTLIL